MLALIEGSCARILERSTLDARRRARSRRVSLSGSGLDLDDIVDADESRLGGLLVAALPVAAAAYDLLFIRNSHL